MSVCFLNVNKRTFGVMKNKSQKAFENRLKQNKNKK